MATNTKASGRHPRSVTVFWVLTSVTWWLGLATAIGLASLLIAVWLTDFQVKFIQLPLIVEFGAEGWVDESGHRPPIFAFAMPQIQTVDNDPFQKWVLFFPAVLLAAFLFAVYHVRSFIANIRAARPFAIENGRHLRIVAWTILATGPAWGLMDHLYGRIYMAFLTMNRADVQPTMNMHVELIAAGLFALVLAYAFDWGAKLQHEQDLTV